MYRVYDITVGDTNYHSLSVLMNAYDNSFSRSFNQDSFSELRIYFDDSDATGTLLFSDSLGSLNNKYGNKLGVGDQTIIRQEGNWIGVQEIFVKTSTNTGRIHVEAIGR